MIEQFLQTVRECKILMLLSIPVLVELYLRMA